MSQQRDALAVGGRTPLVAVIIGAVAAAISLLRLWWGNHESLTQVVWAEDGVFPLCIEKAGFFTCLVDPFAGYLLLLPRLVAGIVALVPVEQWALTTNLLAALFAGVVAALAFAVARRFGLGWVASVVIGLLPVIIPVVGFEAINALGSSYMLLLYLSTIVLAFPTSAPRLRWTGTITVAVLLLVTTLTIPTAGVFLALILVQVIRRAVPWRAGVVWAAAVAAGLVAQWVTAVNAAKPRVINASVDTFWGWVDGVPNMLLTYWPGLRLDSFDEMDIFAVTPLPITGLLVTLAIVVGGLLLMVRGGDGPVAIGLLLVTGIVVGAFPAIISGSGNRYFVVPLLLWGAATLVALDPLIRRSRPWVIVVVTGIVVLVWWTSFPASGFRTSPAPPWQGEVLRVKNACRVDPALQERLIFSPYWPPNWGDALSEPTHPDLPCTLVVGRWGAPES